MPGFARGLINGNICLHRHKTIKSHEDSRRSVEEHLQSIDLKNSELISEKRVLLLDDVLTTGNSMTACSRILEQAKPALLYRMALAKTNQLDYEETDEGSEFFLEKIHKIIEYYDREKMELEYRIQELEEEMCDLSLSLEGLHYEADCYERLREEIQNLTGLVWRESL